MVCDVCWTPEPTYNGSPALRQTGKDAQAPIFGTPPRSYGVQDLRKIDLCGECLNLFQARDWKAIADRSKNALLRQAGIEIIEESA